MVHASFTHYTNVYRIKYFLSIRIGVPKDLQMNKMNKKEKQATKDYFNLCQLKCDIRVWVDDKFKGT